MLYFSVEMNKEIENKKLKRRDSKIYISVTYWKIRLYNLKWVGYYSYKLKKKKKN